MFLKMFSQNMLKWLVSVTILALSGCMDIEQEIWIHDDASATIEYRVGLHEHSLEVAKHKSPDIVCSDVHQDKSVLESLEGVEQVEQQTRHESGIYYCDTKVKVEHYSQLKSVHEKIMASKAGESQSLAERYLAEFTLQENNEGKGYFRQHVMNKAGDEKNKSRLDIQVQGLADMLVGQAMAGRYWTITLHGSDITSANSEINKEKQQVVWRVPLYDLMVDQNYAFDMQASFEVDLPWYQKLWKWVT